MKHPPRVLPKLPNEILLTIFKIVGAESTRDLEPLTLVGQYWHPVAASLLLATISISSLRGILDLCSLRHPSPTARRTGGARPSSILKYTRTIVLAGETWCDTTDLEKQLLGFPDSYGTLGEEKKVLRNLGIYQSPQDISRIIQDTLPHLVSLERLEWYGRFPGDYYLVSQLQQTSVIRSLVYGVDPQGYNELSTSYCEHAFSFTGLTSVEVVFNWPDIDRGTPNEMFDMMQSNPELEAISYGIQDTDARTLDWYMYDLIASPSARYGEVLRPFVWPNLRSLDLEISQRILWESASCVELFAEFLVVHTRLEELILYEMESDFVTTKPCYPFSLSPYPEALACLKKLMAPECFLACILESPAACMSVRTVIDNSIASYEDDLWPDAEITCGERVLRCFESIPCSQVTELSLGVPQLNRDTFVKLAQFAPSIRNLDLFRYETGVSSMDWFAPGIEDEDEDEDAESDTIIFWLNMFPNLEVIGHDIAAAYISLFDDKEQAIIDLGRRIPGLKGIQLFNQDLQLLYVRTSCESLGVELGKGCPEDFREYPQDGALSDWVHRPVSRRAKQVKWIAQTKASWRKPSDYF